MPWKRVRKSFRRARSCLKFGGGWTRTGPSFAPRGRIVSVKYRSESSTSLRRAICVIRCGALSTKVNPSGTAAFHPATVLAFGIR